MTTQLSLKERNRQPVGAAQLGKPGRLVIRGETKAIKDALRARGWRYDPATRTWSMDLVAAHADRVRNGGEDRIEFIRGLNGFKKGVQVTLDGEPVFTDGGYAAANPAANPGGGDVARTRTSGSREGAPRVGAPLKDKDGAYHVVTGVRSSYDGDTTLYTHHYTTRQATPAEAVAFEIRDLETTISRRSSPDDDRSMADYDAETQRLRDRLAELKGGE